MDLERVDQAVKVLGGVTLLLIGSGWVIEEFGVELELSGFTHLAGPLYIAAFAVGLPTFLLILYARNLRDKGILQLAALNNWRVDQNFGKKGAGFFSGYKKIGSVDITDLPLFKSATQLRNALVNVDGFADAIGVKTGSSDSSVMQTVYCFQNQFDSPVFQIHKEGVVSKVGQMVSGSVGADRDIDFDEDRDFSDSFVLKGDEEEAVRALFVGSLRQYFCEHPSMHDWVIESSREITIFYQRAQLAPPDAILSQRKECLSIHKKLDSYRQRF